MAVGFYFVTVLMCSLQLIEITSGATNKKNFNPIIYPGPIQEDINRFGTISDQGSNATADPCDGLTYCTVKPQDYPQDLFNQILRGKIKEPIPLPAYVMTDDRQGDPDDMDDCESVVEYQPLYKVRDMEGGWHTVVQAPQENYVQMVRMETCKNVGGSCFNDFRAPSDLKPFCKQKFTVWEFLVHDGKDGTEKIRTNLPMCCSCHFKIKGI